MADLDRYDLQNAVARALQRLRGKNNSASLSQIGVALREISKMKGQGDAHQNGVMINVEGILKNAERTLKQGDTFNADNHLGYALEQIISNL